MCLVYLVQPIGVNCYEVMYYGCFGFRGELGFLNFDDVCMCVVNKQFELLEFVSDSVYVDLQYDEISLIFTAGSVCLCGVSSPVVVLGLFVRCPNALCCECGCCGDCDACAVVCVACVCAVRVTAMLMWGPGGVVAVSACMCGTRGSGVLSSTGDVHEMSVVKGVGGVCDMCMWLARGGVGGERGEWLRELGLGFTNPVGTGGVLDMCLCFGCGGVGGELVGGLDQDRERWGGVMSV